MASTERSLGWATSGTGDGPLAGYDSSRWRANAQKSDGTGVTLFGSYMVMSGTGTSTLTIADGAALINGYTYETNGSVTISTTGLSGTYNVYIIANTAAGTQTVAANGAGTTTIAASTIRAAIVTSAQISTIQTSVGTANMLNLGGVTITAGSITTITQGGALARTLTMPSQVYAYMQITGSTTAPNGASTTITNYTSSSSSGEGGITIDTTNGTFTSQYGGMYMVTGHVYWDSNTTGSRTLNIACLGGTNVGNQLITQTNTASAISFNTRMQISGLIYLAAGVNVSLITNQNSGASRTISDVYFSLAMA